MLSVVVVSGVSDVVDAAAVVDADDFSLLEAVVAVEGAAEVVGLVGAV